MSIATQILRLRNLRNTLTGILQNKGLISSGQHTLQEDVEAVENIVYSYNNLQDVSIILGSSALDASSPMYIRYDASPGYDGLRKIDFIIDSNSIRPEYIVTGKTLLGVTGNATESFKPFILFWHFHIPENSPSYEIVLHSSDASCRDIEGRLTGNFTFTPGDSLPLINPSNSYLCCYREDCSIHNIICNEINYISNSQYIANNKNGGTITGDCSLNYTNNNTDITLSADGLSLFVGSYCLEILYCYNMLGYIIW